MYNKHFRSKESRSKTSEKISGFIWITNGIENIRMSKTQDIPKGYFKGRTV